MSAKPLSFVPTRIINLSTQPSQPTAGQAAIIKGTLQYWVLFWSGLASANVQIFVNGSYVGSATTNGDGVFELPYVFPQPGTYVVKAYYPGNSTFDSTSSVIEVTVVSAAQAAAQSFALGLIIAAGSALAVILAAELISIARKG